MKTIEVNLYQFSELSERAKQKVISEFNNVDHDWWDSTYADAATIGLRITSSDFDHYVNGEFTLSACEVAQNILNNHGETCETYKTAKEFMDAWQPIFNDYMDEESENYESGELEDELQDLEDEFLKSLREDYRIILRNEYEYLTSEKAIIETIEANEYYFTEDGKLY